MCYEVPCTAVDVDYTHTHIYIAGKLVGPDNKCVEEAKQTGFHGLMGEYLPSIKMISNCHYAFKFGTHPYNH